MFPARFSLLPAIFALSGFISPTCLGAIKLALSESPGVTADAVVLKPQAAAPNSADTQLTPREDEGGAVHRGLKIARSPDGLFYLTAQINGVATRFLVDTGSNSVVLSRRDAAAAGVERSGMTFGATMNTAGGSTRINWSTLDSVKVGNREIHGLEAVVTQNGLPVSLMGQSVLSHLGVITIDGDWLELK